MTDHFKERTTTLFFFIVSTFLFVFAALKAYNAPLYWDEIYTYQNYVKQNIILLSKYSYLYLLN